MLRRTTLAVIGLAGLLLILLTLAFGMWGKSQAIHALVKSFGPGYQPASMRQSQADFRTVSAMSSQLQTEALPGLAAQLKVTPAQLETSLASTYPAVGQGLAEMPAALAWFGNLGSRIARERGDYEKAAAIPVKGVAASAVPWLMVIPGVLLALGAGIAVFSRPAWSRGVAIFGIVVGVSLIVGPLVVKLPSKASAVDRLVAQFKPILTSPGPQTTARYVSTMSAMSAQLSGQALPALAHELHMTTPGLEQMLAATYPAVGRGFTQLPAILPRFQAMSQLIKANVGNYHAAEALPWKVAPAIMLYWFLAIPGALAAIGGGALLVLARRARARQAAYAAAPA
jgi:hypothetical protein